MFVESKMTEKRAEKSIGDIVRNVVREIEKRGPDKETKLKVEKYDKKKAALQPKICYPGSPDTPIARANSWPSSTTTPRYTSARRPRLTLRRTSAFHLHRYIR